MPLDTLNTYIRGIIRSYIIRERLYIEQFPQNERKYRRTIKILEDITKEIDKLFKEEEKHE